MYDGIIRIRLKVMALILLFLSVFLSFSSLHANIVNMCQFSQVILELES